MHAPDTRKIIPPINSTAPLGKPYGSGAIHCEHFAIHLLMCIQLLKNLLYLPQEVFLGEILLDNVLRFFYCTL